MDTCALISGLIVITGLVAVLFVLFRAYNSSTESPPNPFEFCPGCDGLLRPTDINCPQCRLVLQSKLARRLDNLIIARREIRKLLDEGELDAETAGRVTEQLRLRKQSLLRPRPRTQPNDAPVPLPPPLPEESSRPSSSPRPMREEPERAPARPEQFPPELPRPRREVPPPLRRSLANAFGQFMHERNILWGELAGGLLIVGCSIALVISLWRTLEELPYFTFLLSAGITSAVFGAGYYTFHHWKLAGTSRGLLVIALLLTPLNLLLLADPGARGTPDAFDIAVKIVAVLVFSWLVRTGGRDLIEEDGVRRRWSLVLSLVGAPASQMLPSALEGDFFLHQPSWLPVICFTFACVFTVGRLTRSQRRVDAPPMQEGSASGILLFVGLALFGLLAAWGFVLSRGQDLTIAIQHLAIPTILAGVPVLSAGLLVQRRLKEPVGLRATGTGVAVAGMIVLFASLIFAWPDPATLLMSAVAVGLFLGWMGYRDESPWMYAGSIPCLALALVLGYHGVTGGWSTPQEIPLAVWLSQQITSAQSGAVLAGFSLVLCLGAEWFVRRSRGDHGRALAIGSLGVSIVSLLFVTIHGPGFPLLAAITHLVVALGFIAASFRWRFRIVSHVGAWLFLLASLWGLQAIVPAQRDVWGLVIACESLLLGTAALGMRSLKNLQRAFRDVAAAAAILAPAIGFLFVDSRTNSVQSGLLFAMCGTCLVLAGLYRERVLTWAGSLIGLLALVHLLLFPLVVETWRLTVLHSLLVHANVALVAAITFRSRALFADPLRYSARLTLCLAIPLLVLPIPSYANLWALLALWAGLLWLLNAIVWRERGFFQMFQATLTWSVLLLGFAWVERQAWFPDSRFGMFDPRALHSYGICLASLSIAWLIARRLLQRFELVRRLWNEVRPSVDQLVLGGLVIAQLVLAAGGLFPAIVQELTQLGASPAFVPVPESALLWSAGAWLLLGLLALSLLLAGWWTNKSRAELPLIGLVLLSLTVPFLIAGRFAPELASASALRWGMALVFIAGSIFVALRERIARLGVTSVVLPWSPVILRGLFAGAAGIVLLLSCRVAFLGLMGESPAGPLAESVFRRMGWTASVMIPLAVIVIGLAGTALRERSAGYAFVGGGVWIATVAGAYALAVVSSGESITPSQQMRIALLAISAAAVWSLGWIGVVRRVPDAGLLTSTIAGSLFGLACTCCIPLGLLLVDPTKPLGPASARLGSEGWAALLLVFAAIYWYVDRRWRSHVLTAGTVVAGILIACAVQPRDTAGKWLSFHVLQATWAVAGIGLAAYSARSTSESKRSTRWIEALAAGLTILGVRGAWSDPIAWAPSVAVSVAGLFTFILAARLRSRAHEYLSGFLAVVSGWLMWIAWSPNTPTSLMLALAASLAVASSGFAFMWAMQTRRDTESDLPADREDTLPPFTHVGALLSLALLLFGLIPTLAGRAFDPPFLAWGALVAVGCVLVLLGKDSRARFTLGAFYLLGMATIALTVSEFRPGPVWLDWPLPLALAAFAFGASFVSRSFMKRVAPDWLLLMQGCTVLFILAMATRLAVIEPNIATRFVAPLAAFILVPAGWSLVRNAGNRQSDVRQTTLALGAVAFGLLAWAIPDPAGTVPWLNRHAGLFVALTACCAIYLNVNSARVEFKRMAGYVGVIAFLVLGVLLIQQIPQFDPDPLVKKTPLTPLAIAAVIVAMLTMLVLALECALKPNRDPLGPSPRGRTGYVYLAQIVLVLLFAHIRLNVPQVFIGDAVRYWTFIVMLLAFAGVGLAELFARRGLSVLAKPLLRTGVLLPLIPLLAFWAKPPAMLMAYADDRAPGLRPMLGYLEKLPQHFDVYALLWFLAGMLYGLIALSRRSFGWALMGALATNAGLWALLFHNNVPAIVHPQAWAIPLALIVLISEHVNRHRLRASVASGLRYLGITMIYVASASDLFIAGVGHSHWLPVILAALCIAGMMAGVLFRVRAFLYLGLGFLMLDVFAMIWHAAVDRSQTWVWYASGIVLGAMILALFAILEKKRNDVRDLMGKLREWN